MLVDPTVCSMPHSMVGSLLRHAALALVREAGARVYACPALYPAPGVWPMGSAVKAPPHPPTPEGAHQPQHYTPLYANGIDHGMYVNYSHCWLLTPSLPVPPTGTVCEAKAA